MHKNAHIAQTIISEPYEKRSNAREMPCGLLTSWPQF